MIVTSQEEWVSLYQSIKEDSARSDEKQVFVYASAADADAVCALRILEVGAGPQPLAGRVVGCGSSSRSSSW